MTDDDIKRLRRLAEQATPGPWRVNMKGHSYHEVARVNDLEIAPPNSVDLSHWTVDAAYIAAASPDVVLALLDEIERLRRDGFDSRHPAAQNLIGRNARLSIALDIAGDILADDCEPTPITAEHWAPIHDQVQSVVRERNDLRAEVERLRADAARLDHIEKHARYDPKIDGNHAWWPTTFENVLRGPTLRAAIDAAMKEKRK